MQVCISAPPLKNLVFFHFFTMHAICTQFVSPPPSLVAPPVALVQLYKGHTLTFSHFVVFLFSTRTPSSLKRETMYIIFSLLVVNKCFSLRSIRTSVHFIIYQSLPVSLEVGLVTDERHGSVVTAESLVFADDVQVSGRLVKTASTYDRVDDDKRACPLQIAFRLFVCLQYTSPNAGNNNPKVIQRKTKSLLVFNRQVVAAIAIACSSCEARPLNLPFPWARNPVTGPHNFKCTCYQWRSQKGGQRAQPSPILHTQHKQNLPIKSVYFRKNN